MMTTEAPQVVDGIEVQDSNSPVLLKQIPPVEEINVTSAKKSTSMPFNPSTPPAIGNDIESQAVIPKWNTTEYWRPFFDITQEQVCNHLTFLVL